MSHLKDIKPSPNLCSLFTELENDGVFGGFSKSGISSSRDTTWFRIFHVCCLRCTLPKNSDVGRRTILSPSLFLLLLTGYRTWKCRDICSISMIMYDISQIFIHSNPSNTLCTPPKKLLKRPVTLLFSKICTNFFLLQIDVGPTVSRHAQADVWSVQDVGNGLKRSKSSMAPPLNVMKGCG